MDDFPSRLESQIISKSLMAEFGGNLASSFLNHGPRLGFGFSEEAMRRESPRLPAKRTRPSAPVVSWLPYSLLIPLLELW